MFFFGHDCFCFAGFIHSVIILCACKCANLPLSERVPGVTQATVAP
jgi:hypothetical protein